MYLKSCFGIVLELFIPTISFSFCLVFFFPPNSLKSFYCMLSHFSGVPFPIGIGNKKDKVLWILWAPKAKPFGPVHCLYCCWEPYAKSSELSPFHPLQATAIARMKI